MKLQLSMRAYGRSLCFAVSIPLIAALALLAAGCPRPPQYQDNVSAETQRAASKTIGPAGGEILCTAADGTAYTLIIPPDALSFPTEITMAPITQIRSLPLSGGLAGAVDLKPTGLLFTRPAVLEVDTSESPAGAELVLGFSFEGDADKFGLGIAGEDDGVLRLLVTHFSGAGIGFGTLQDVAAFQPDGVPDEDLASRLLSQSGSPDTQAQQTALL